MAERIKVKFAERLTHVTRDFTIGEVYTAFKLTPYSTEADGDFVDCDDGIKLLDDVGDMVYTKLSLGFELIEDDDCATAQA